MFTPAVEALAALLILGGNWLGLALAGALGFAFAVVGAAVVFRGIPVSCGCSGSGATKVSYVTVFRGAAIFAAALLLFRIPVRLGLLSAGAAVLLGLVPSLLLVQRRISHWSRARRAARRRGQELAALEAIVFPAPG
jgi:hypothetical protein